MNDRSYDIHQGNVWGYDVTQAIFHFNFSTDLYFLISLPCPYVPNKCMNLKQQKIPYQIQEPLKTVICQNCDYSDPKECPKLPPNATCTQCPIDKESWCSGSWIQIKDGDEIQVPSNITGLGLHTTFRFYVSEKLACQPFQLTLTPTFGDADLHLGFQPPDWNIDWSTWSSTSIDGNAELIYGCPYVDETCQCLVPSGTYFIGVRYWSPVSYELSLKFFDIYILYNISGVTEESNYYGDNHLYEQEQEQEEEEEMEIENQNQIKINKNQYTKEGIIIRKGRGGTGVYPSPSCPPPMLKSSQYCPEDSIYPCLYPGKMYSGEFDTQGTQTFSVYVSANCPLLVSTYLATKVRYLTFTIEYEGIIYETILGGIQQLSLSFCYTSTDYLHLIVRVTNEMDEQQKYNLTIVADGKQFNLIRLGDLNPYAGAYDLSASSTLLCTNSSIPFDYDQRGYSTSPYHFIPPKIDYNSMWPPPYPLTSYALELNSIQLPQPPQIGATNTFLSSVIMEVTFPDLFSVKFLNEEDLKSKCSVSWKNQIVDCDYMPIPQYAEPTRTKTEPICNYDDFQSLSKKMKDAMAQMQNFTLASQFEDWRYQLDSYVFNEIWYGCNELLNSLIISNQTDEVLNEKSCYSQDDQSDPCCDSEAYWYESCVKRDVTRTFSSFEINETKSHSICPDTSCLDTFLSDYIYERSKDEGSNVTGCSAILENIEVFKATSIEAFQRCLEEVFPNFPYPRNCNSDGQCLDGKCDLFTFQCVTSMDNLSNQFLNCFENYSSTFILYNLSERSKFSWKELIQKIIRRQDCVHNSYGLPVQNSTSLHSLWRYTSFGCEDRCPVIPCLFYDCRLPLTCKGKTPCDKYWVFDPPNEDECFENSYVCNWNPGLSQGECLSESPTEFCGISEDNLTFTEIRYYKDQETCENTSVCVSPTGLIFPDISDPKQCLELGMCSNPCYDPKCASSLFPNGVCYCNTNKTNCQGEWREDLQVCVVSKTTAECISSDCHYEDCASLTLDACEECENGDCIFNVSSCYREYFRDCDTYKECRVYGVGCTDQKYLIHPQCLNSTKYGGCVKPLSPWINEECGDGYLTTNIGCIWNKTCVTKDQCLALDSSHYWLNIATSHEECLSQGIGCSEFVIGSQDPKLTGEWQTPKNNSECEKVFGGVTTPFFNWEPPKWFYGVIRDLKWAKREWIPTRSYVETFDFTTFGMLVESAIQEQYSFQLNSESNCRFSRLLSTMEKVVCANSKNCEKSCWDDWDQENSAGSARICSDSFDEIIVPPIIFYIPYGTVDESDKCLDLYVSGISKEECKRVQPHKLTIQWGYQQKWKDYVIVKNSHDARIGQVIGDGVLLSISDGKHLNKVTLCFDWLRSYLDLYPGEYPIFDFAKSSTDLESLMSMNLETFEFHGQLCANVSSIQPINTFYFPIIRKESYDSVQYVIFSTGEQITLIITSLLYLGNVLYGIFLFFYFKFSPTEQRPLKIATLFMFFLLLFNLGRFAYYTELGFEPFTVRDRLFGYVLYELPTFIYITAYSVIVIYWYAVLKTKSRRNKTRKVFNLYWSLFNFLLYMTLFAFVVLYEELPYPDESHCGGRIIETSSRAADEIMIVTYRSFIALISLGLAACYMFYGRQMYLSLTAFGAYEDQVRNVKLIMTSLTCGVSFIMDSTFYDVLAIVNTSIPAYWALLLILIEILPSFVMLTLISPFSDQMIRNAYYGTRTNQLVNSCPNVDNLVRPPPSIPAFIPSTTISTTFQTPTPSPGETSFSESEPSPSSRLLS